MVSQCPKMTWGKTGPTGKVKGIKERYHFWLNTYSVSRVVYV